MIFWLSLVYHTLLVLFLISAAVLCVVSVLERDKAPDSKAYVVSLVTAVALGGVWTGTALWIMVSGVTI